MRRPPGHPRDIRHSGREDGFRERRRLHDASFDLSLHSFSGLLALYLHGVGTPTPGSVEILGTAPLDLHVEAASHDGDNSGDQFGYAVNGAGDLDNDGVPDYVVGAPGDGNAAVSTPYARAFSGADDRRPIETSP